MSVFTVDMENKPGELARLCDAMADSHINVVLSAAARGDEGSVAFVADDEAGAQAALLDAGLRYQMRSALTIRLENQPGTGAVTFRKLADAGVNAELLLPIRVSDDLFFAVVVVDDEERARDALGDQIVSVLGGSGGLRGLRRGLLVTERLLRERVVRTEDQRVASALGSLLLLR